MFKQVIYFFLVVILAIIQVSLFSQFTFLQKSLNLIVVFITLITLFENYRKAIITSLILGLVLDLYSGFSFGIITSALLLPVVICYILIQKFFARKSVLALTIITVINTFVYNITIFLLSSITYWLGWNNFHVMTDINYFTDIFKQAIFNTLALVTIYIIVKFLDKKLRLKFLISGNAKL